MEKLPLYIPVVFIATTILALYLLYKSTGRSRITIVVALLWLILQAFTGMSGFYTDTNTMPPRFILALGPPLLIIILLFIARRGRTFLDNWNLKWLTWLHVVRIPVELVLYWLFVYKQVPRLMTFEGINYDILSGITAPVIVLLCFHAQKLRKILLLIWNIICLGLLLNIVIHAILSAPLPFQQLAFDQPNVAVLYFPYVWLPAFIVPAVLLAHLVAIRQLLASWQ
ncbi:hypothetical protein HB364_29355 [Pseudoflavitalea sp. X16]|uniref:hypothetical protein n=1 Tax=Paraflavitalea devenefica TaxID=2716334 RepID=UPI00141FFE1D|nr:hypothetical protein [Paraflavitalea devenefica]NII29223.1 hypothetical protein [Paraflavitalea devenefica]